MKKVLIAAMATGLVSGGALAGANGAVDFVSAYVYRGTTISDEFNLQPSIELSGFGMPEEYGEFIAGAWGTLAPFTTALETPYETDWYATYMLPEFAEGLDLSIGVLEYMYSGAENELELNAAAGYAFGDFYLAASINYMSFNQGPLDATEGQIYIPLSLDWTTELSEDLDGSVGGLVSYMKQGDGNKNSGLKDGFNDYEIYGALNYGLSDVWTLGGSLVYIGQGDDQVLSDAAYDVDVVGMLSLSCEM
jgi:uncharacterized protein (TIGR02001 family)